jgi:putative phosphoribosyl transferase
VIDRSWTLSGFGGSKALYRDRTDAGQKLAQKLNEYKDRKDVLVIALPRGGVPVAYEVAKGLNAPLDVFMVRKLGVPGHEELAMGAIASGGIRVLNEELVAALDIPEWIVNAVADREQIELERREQAYRQGRPRAKVQGKRVILIDDGLATGFSMRAAIEGLRAQDPAQIIVAVPIAPVETCEMFEQEVDQIVCAATPEPFFGVGLWYENFEQTSDEEVRESLERATESIQ